MTDKSGKSAAVLGASEEGGTGWAIATALSKRGFDLTIGARRQAGLDKLGQQVGAKAISCDATSEPDVERFMQSAAEAKPIDCAVLVAGAGVRGTIDGISTADFEHSLTLNFRAAFYFARHAARVMNDNGSIVFISTIAASNAWPGYVAYGTAKAALETLVRYAALEFSDRGIRVNAVSPGPISTPAAGHFVDHPQAGRILADEVPLGRVASPEEVAEAVAWLGTSPGWITGETIHTDGGMFLRRPPDMTAVTRAFEQGGK